ncbi:MAG: hypothetical protein OXI60_11770 [Acidiferrobacterales bacterium]|nr:hypothetical protein [Acidiferrobacterales bacterium]
MPEPALQPLSRLVQPLSGNRPGWNFQEVQGRLVEISEPHPVAALSFCFLLVHEVQMTGGSAVWVGSTDSTFYPPDAEKGGIDLRNLPILRLADTRSLVRAAEILLRSGAFQLVLLDLGRSHTMPVARLAQLNGLVRKHGACAVFLTRKPHNEQSVGPLISLHARTSRQRVETNAFFCELQILRDKRRGRKWTWQTCLCGVKGYF